MQTRVQHNDTMLEWISSIHDQFGPRAALAWYLGNDPKDTEKLETNQVEDFIIDFYQQYNRRYGRHY